MAWLISALGAALALAGSVSLWNGISYIRLDWGQTETVAGTVGLSGGIITIALSAVLFALRDLQRRPARAASTGVGLEALSLGDDEVAPPSSPGGRDASGPAAPDVPRTLPVGAETLVPAGEREIPSMRAAYDPAPPAGPRAEPEMLPNPRHRPAELPHEEPALAEAPTVVGRYEANGASYVLFSDGTIEVETESGTHRFSSMAELKEHIERQDEV